MLKGFSAAQLKRTSSSPHCASIPKHWSCVNTGTSGCLLRMQMAGHDSCVSCSSFHTELSTCASKGCDLHSTAVPAYWVWTVSIMTAELPCPMSAVLLGPLHVIHTSSNAEPSHVRGAGELDAALLLAMPARRIGISSEFERTSYDQLISHHRETTVSK